MTTLMDLLKSIPLFTDLGINELEIIKPDIFEKTVRRGDMVFFEGEPSDSLYFVVTGAAKIFKTSTQGKEQILSIARPFELLNDSSIFDRGTNSSSAQALTEMNLYGLKKEKFSMLMRRYPALAINAARVLTQRNQQLLSLVEDLSFKHVISRVGKILLENVAGGIEPKPKLTQQEMAAMAGTAREVVARSLKDLEERGVIKFDRHRIVIVNKDELKNLVDESV